MKKIPKQSFYTGDTPMPYFVLLNNYYGPIRTSYTFHWKRWNRGNRRHWYIVWR